MFSKSFKIATDQDELVLNVRKASSLKERLVSGQMLSKSNSSVTPRPEHSLQAPNGLLNEKSLGSIRGSENPHKGQLLCSVNSLSIFPNHYQFPLLNIH